MLLRRSLYFLIFIFFIGLALATRNHSNWFPSLVQTYGGDVFWSAAFLFLLRSLFIRAKLWKLAVACYVLGVLDELSQLLQFDWIVAIRETHIGRLMLGVGFVWSDILCYAIGTLLAWGILFIIEKKLSTQQDLGNKKM